MKSHLMGIRGHLVKFPLDFLKLEDLAPNVLDPKNFDLLFTDDKVFVWWIFVHKSKSML